MKVKNLIFTVILLNFSLIISMEKSIDESKVSEKGQPAQDELANNEDSFASAEINSSPKSLLKIGLVTAGATVAFAGVVALGKKIYGDWQTSKEIARLEANPFGQAAVRAKQEPYYFTDYQTIVKDFFSNNADGAGIWDGLQSGDPYRLLEMADSLMMPQFTKVQLVIIAKVYTDESNNAEVEQVLKEHALERIRNYFEEGRSAELLALPGPITLTEDQRQALTGLHTRIIRSNERWTKEVEGVRCPVDEILALVNLYKQNPTIQSQELHAAIFKVILKERKESQEGAL